MKLRLLAVALFVAVASLEAHAQFAFYINPIATRVSLSTPDQGLYSFLGPNQTSRMFGGVNLGVYYDAFRSNHLVAGIDLRESVVNGNGALLNTFAFGPRISYQSENTRFKPYIEPYLAAGTTRSPNTAIHLTRAEYGVFAGTDFRLHRHIDWRAIEVGYGSVTTTSDGTIGGTQAVPTAKLLSFGSGLVFHF